MIFSRMREKLAVSSVCILAIYVVIANGGNVRRYSSNFFQPAFYPPFYGSYGPVFQSVPVESNQRVVQQPDVSVRGSQRLPLRDAVQSRPFNFPAYSPLTLGKASLEPKEDPPRIDEDQFGSHRVPLRDAVEAFPGISPEIPPFILNPSKREGAYEPYSSFYDNRPIVGFNRDAVEGRNLPTWRTQLETESTDGIIVSNEQSYPVPPAPSKDPAGENIFFNLNDHHKFRKLNSECLMRGYARDPEYCNVFYVCSEGRRFTHHCPHGLVFDDILRLCAWPRHVKCPSQSKLKEFVCDSKDDGLWTDPSDCGMFYYCQKGVKHHMTCPPGLWFDPEAGVCDYSYKAKCAMGSLVKVKSLTQVADKPSKRSGQLPYIMCYFTSWAKYRPGLGEFVPERVDPSLCTHVVYSFAKIDHKTYKINSSDPYTDFEEKLVSRLQSITKAANARYLLAVGGWTDSGSDKYSKMVNSAANRAVFIQSAVAFLQKHGFDGMSFDWTFPVCWQFRCDESHASDKIGFTNLIKELRQAFDAASPPLELVASISGYKSIIDRAYDIPALSQNLDIIQVMTFDYHGPWESNTGHVAPLTAPNSLNADSAMQYLVSLGADKTKLVMGVPFYGQSYMLSDLVTTPPGFAYPTSGVGNPGPFTNQPGMLAYYEICAYVRESHWSKVSGDAARGPYAYRNDQFVSYDDIQMVERKAKYVRNNGFGGVLVWTIAMDDFRNRCCRGAFPLLRTINSALRDEGTIPAIGNCEAVPEPVTPASPNRTIPFDSGISTVSTTEHMHHTSTTTAPATVLSSTTIPPWAPPSTVTTSTPSTTSTSPSTSWTWAPATSSSISWPQWTPPSTTRTTWPQWTPSSTSSTSWPQWTPSSTSSSSWPLWTPSTSPSTSWTPSPTPSTTTHGQKPTLSATCEHGTFYRDPESNDCSKYLLCTFDQLASYMCPFGTVFSHALRRCEYPDNVVCDALSDSGSTPPPPPPSSTAPPPPSSTVSPPPPSTSRSRRCSSLSEDYSEHESDCSRYYRCVFGYWNEQRCFGSLQWNQARKICDWAYNVKCEKPGSGTTASPGPTVSTASSTSTWTPTQSSTTQWSWTPTQSSTQWSWTPPQATTTPAPSTLPPIPFVESKYKIVCYFTNWAWYRKGVGKYRPSNIDPELCTHIVYGFAVLDYSNLIIKPHDGWADLENDFYRKVTAFKRRGVKVLIAIGGWNDSRGDKYSRLANNPAARKKFIDHVMGFIALYDFDGLDLDWEYPACPQVNCASGNPEDKQAFAVLVKELKEAFRPRGWLVTAAVSPSKKVIDAGYDVASISRDLDWIAVMTYDFHGHWDKRTGHVAPHYHHPGNTLPYFNSHFALEYWLQKGATKDKIVMGLPFYGQTFKLSDAANNGLKARASGPGDAGPVTGQRGFVSYYEICSKLKEGGWTVVQDPKRRMGPYMYKGDQWISFDDADMIRQKSEYIIKQNLAGGMIWALDLDDFSGSCGEGKHPLLVTMNQVLRVSTDSPGAVATTTTTAAAPAVPAAPTAAPTASTTTAAAAITKTTTSTTTTTSTFTRPTTTTSATRPPTPTRPPTQVIPPSTPQTGFKVVCYFTNWAWYRQSLGKYLPSDIDAKLCTHIVYGFAVLDQTTLLTKPHDTWADLDNKFYEKVTAFKKYGAKVLLALGGWNDSRGNKYSRLVSSQASRKKFIDHIVGFLETHNFDGLDLDWEYPSCPQVDCSKGPRSDKQMFTAWVRELSEVFKPRGLLLSTAVSPSIPVVENAYEVAEISKYFDWIAVMTYDYHGQWDKQTGHVAPLYHHPMNKFDHFNANTSIHHWLNKGAPKDIIVMGMPMYGQSFTLSDATNTGLQSRTYGGAEAGQFTRVRGFLAYYEICHSIDHKGWKVIRDPQKRMGPYAVGGSNWVGFDDVETIRQKSEYVKSMGLAGAMIWALDLDDFRNRCGCEAHPLLKTINRVLRNYPNPDKTCTL